MLMFLKRRLPFSPDGVWLKILFFASTLFLIRLADGIISFWAPNEIQGFFGSSLWMGLIISIQSIVGFLADLIFPYLLKTTKVRKMVFWAIIMSAFTAFFLTGATVKPFLALFVITMVVWGIYYELIAFANYQFMGSVVPSHMRSSAWGVAGIFSSLAYFLGPLIAAVLIQKGYVITVTFILVFLVTAFIMLSTTKNMHDAPVQIDLKKINPWVELKHWLTLSKTIWPAIVISVLLGFIDSTFWTTGAVWSEKLSRISYLGGFFLPFYQLPPIFLGFVIAKWGVYKGKKILAEKFLLVAGLFLIALAFSEGVIWQISMVILSSIALSLCYPLLEGVYSDIVARMGKEKKDMIGLTSSTVNMSYIVWPPIAGLIAGIVGERMTFSILGIIVVVVSTILIFVTPKKLRLPQEEIKSWD